MNEKAEAEKLAGFNKNRKSGAGGNRTNGKKYFPKNTKKRR